MIKTIEIQNLFGRFNYCIKTMLGGITIITGPNGFGKSTILHIINSLSKGDFFYFNDLDFSELTVTFDNGEFITLSKASGSLKLNELELPFLDKSREENIRSIRRFPWIRRTSDGYYFDRRTDTKLSPDEYYLYSLKNIYLDDDDYYENGKQKNKINIIIDKAYQIKEWCGAVRFISDQRLIKQVTSHSEETYVVDVISELPDRLKKEISRVTGEYSRVSNQLDSTYPKRLFATTEGINDQEEFDSRLKEANEKFEKLDKYNLVDISIIDEENYNSVHSLALKIYFEDFAEKYKVFQELISKLDLFTKIINTRLTFKHIVISREKGFYVVDNDDENKTLKLSQLSSGEKQEIVLFYDLIFGTKEKLLLLIDEPEISLHITWQKKFLDDLVEVAKQRDIQVIVATHSPQIVSNHLDIQIDLGELYGEELNNRQSH